jgi:hypothetical protein
MPDLARYSVLRLMHHYEIDIVLLHDDRAAAIFSETHNTCTLQTKAVRINVMSS